MVRVSVIYITYRHRNRTPLKMQQLVIKNTLLINSKKDNLYEQTTVNQRNLHKKNIFMCGT